LARAFGSFLAFVILSSLKRFFLNIEVFNPKNEK
jgi:hypothetical protein